MFTSNDFEQPLTSHLAELRHRLVIILSAWAAAGVVCYIYAQPILDFLVYPLAQAWQGQAQRRLIYTGLAEGFMVHWRIGIYGGLVAAFPIWAWQIWRFVAPGLYRHERRFMRWCLIMGPVLFALGATMVYTIVLPVAWHFFLGFEHTGSSALMPLYFEPRVENYVTLVLKLIVVFGICFQLPLILVIAAKLGWVQPSSLSYYRRHAIVAIFVVAAVITPPDILSQLMLAVPLVLLYEIAVLAVRFVVRKSVIE